MGCFVEPDDDEDDEDDEDDDEEEEEEDDEDEEELSDSLPLRKGRRFRVSEANIASLREQILPNGERAGATCQSPNRTTKTRMKMMMTTMTSSHRAYASYPPSSSWTCLLRGGPAVGAAARTGPESSLQAPR